MGVAMAAFGALGALVTTRSCDSARRGHGDDDLVRAGGRRHADVAAGVPEHGRAGGVVGGHRRAVGFARRGRGRPGEGALGRRGGGCRREVQTRTGRRPGALLPKRPVRPRRASKARRDGARRSGALSPRAPRDNDENARNARRRNHAPTLGTVAVSPNRAERARRSTRRLTITPSVVRYSRRSSPDATSRPIEREGGETHPPRLSRFASPRCARDDHHPSRSRAEPRESINRCRRRRRGTRGTLSRRIHGGAFIHGGVFIAREIEVRDGILGEERVDARADRRVVETGETLDAGEPSRGGPPRERHLPPSFARIRVARALDGKRDGARDDADGEERDDDGGEGVDEERGVRSKAAVAAANAIRGGGNGAAATTVPHRSVRDGDDDGVFRGIIRGGVR